jgi:hypothetical protein
MKYFITIVVLLCLSCPSWATWGVVQHTIGSAACTSTNQTCNLPVSSTGNNDLIIVGLVIAANGEYITAISDGSSSYVVNSGALAGNACAGQDAAPLGSDCGYTLSSVSGKTSITVTRTDATSHIWRVSATEYSFSAASIAFDVVGKRDQSSNCTSCAGVALTLTGTNDAIYQIDASGLPSAITTYSPADFAAHIGAASLINTNSGTAPTWTQSNNPSALSAIAFKEVTGSGTLRRRAMVIQE